MEGGEMKGKAQTPSPIDPRLCYLNMYALHLPE